MRDQGSWLPQNAWVFIGSEVVTAFMWTIAALLLFTIVNSKKYGLDTIWKKRIFASVIGIAIVTTAMFSGLAIGSGNYAKPTPTNGIPMNNWGNQEGGHGWGNPAFAMALAFTQIQHIFSDLPVMVLGILYVTFEFVGAGLAAGFFFIAILVFNKYSNKEDQIILKEVFKWDETHMLIRSGKNAIGTFMFVFAFVGGSVLAAWPTAFPNSDISRVTAVFAAAFTFGLLITLLGVESLIYLNPAVWFGAFAIKFMSHKKITMPQLGKEITIPVSVLATSVVTGAIIYGLININQYP